MKQFLAQTSIGLNSNILLLPEIKSCSSWANFFRFRDWLRRRERKKKFFKWIVKLDMESFLVCSAKSTIKSYKKQFFPDWELECSKSGIWDDGLFSCFFSFNFFFYFSERPFQHLFFPSGSWINWGPWVSDFDSQATCWSNSATYLSLKLSSQKLTLGNFWLMYWIRLENTLILTNTIVLLWL